MFSHMFSLFKTDSSAKESKSSRTHSLSPVMKKTTGFNFNNMLKFALGCNFLTAAQGDVICFETNFNDNEVWTSSPSSTFNHLAKECGAYRDGYDDCVTFFSKKETFGSSPFGYPTCVWKHHDYDIYNPCIPKVLTEICPINGGMGSSAEPWWDWATLAGIIVGGLCVCSCGVFGCNYYCSRNQQAENNQEAVTADASPEAQGFVPLSGKPNDDEDIELADSKNQQTESAEYNRMLRLTK